MYAKLYWHEDIVKYDTDDLEEIIKVWYGEREQMERDMTRNRDICLYTTEQGSILCIIDECAGFYCYVLRKGTEESERETVYSQSSVYCGLTRLPIQDLDFDTFRRFVAHFIFLSDEYGEDFAKFSRTEDGLSSYEYNPACIMNQALDIIDEIDDRMDVDGVDDIKVWYREYVEDMMRGEA